MYIGIYKSLNIHFTHLQHVLEIQILYLCIKRIGIAERKYIRIRNCASENEYDVLLKIKKNTVLLRFYLLVIQNNVWSPDPLIWYSNDADTVEVTSVPSQMKIRPYLRNPTVCC